jgi:4-amino-4-deoxy-L-arabinose transferase-like glycosyltransferase
MNKIKKFKIDKLLLFIVIAFLFCRLLILLTSNNLFHPEECIFRTAVKDIMYGPNLPLLDYQLEPSGGGFLLVVLLAVPISYVLGVSVFSFKLVGLLFSLGILIMVYLILKKVYNKKVALIASFLIILSPPYYTIRNLITSGNYLESIFFSFVIIYFFFESLLDKKNETKKVFLFGLFTGFGTWVYYSSLVAFLSCIIFLLLTKNFKIINKKNILIFIIAFIIGFSPWIFSNFSEGFNSMEKLNYIVKPDFYKPGIFKLKLQKLYNLLVLDIPISFYFNDISSISKKFFAYSYYSIFAFSFLSLFIFNIKKVYREIILKKTKKKGYFPKDLFFLIYFVVYILIFVLTNLKIKYQFYSLWDIRMVISHSNIFSIQPFIMIIIAIGIYKFLNKKKLKNITITIFIFLIITGLIQNISLIDKFNLKNIFNEKLDYNSLGRSVGWKHSNDPFGDYSICFRIDNEPFTKGCFAGIGEGSLYNGVKIKRGEEVCESIDEKYKKYCYMGMGGTIASHPEELNEKCLSLSNKENIKFCFAGAASEFVCASGKSEEITRLCNEYVNEEYVNFCYDGLNMLHR